MSFRNINKIYKHDWKRIFKNPIAMIVLLGVCVIPSLYAWVNIKACWDIYENTQNIPVAVVNSDQNVYYKGNKINVGDQIVEQLKGNNKIKWVFTTTEEANLGILDSTYFAMIEIPSDFSEKLLTLLSDNPQKPQILYKVDTKANPVASKITSSANSTLVQQVTSEFGNTVNQTVFGYLNDLGQTADEGKENILKLKDSMILLNRNMDTINGSLQSIETNSDNLDGLLESISASMPYVQSGLEAVGKLNSDNQKALEDLQSAMENSSKNIDMNLNYAKTSNDKVKALFGSLNDSVASANNTKLNTIIPVINAQLVSVNSSIDATITYLQQCRDADINGDIDKAITDLQNLKTALTDMRAALVQMQTDVTKLHTDVDKLYDSLEKNKDAIKEATENLDAALETAIKDLTELNKLYPNANLEQAIAALQALMNANIGDSLLKLVEDILASRPAVDAALTSLSNTIATTITQIDSALVHINKTIEILQKLKVTNTTVRKEQLNDIIIELSAIKPYIADEQSQLSTIRSNLVSANGIAKSTADLINTDCNKIANQLDSAILLYNSSVKDNVKIIGDNLIVCVKGAGELIENAQGLSTQITNMVKTAQEGNALSSEFSSSLYSKLQQFKDVIKSLGGKLEEVNNDDIANIIGIMRNDPKLMGDYVSNPFEIEEEKIYHIPNYGTGMTPIYTTLAIWVGCLVLNAILKPEVGRFKGYQKLTLREKHFGKMLLFCTLATVQGLIVALGDIFILKIYVVDPALFIFFCVYSSIVYSIITFTLLSSFGNVGKALSIVYLILQVAGSGGAYPIQIAPTIFRILQPLFPFTYTLSGMREAIAGPLSGGVTGDVVGLTVFAVLFLVGGYFTVDRLNRTFHQFELGFKQSGLGE